MADLRCECADEGLREKYVSVCEIRKKQKSLKLQKYHRRKMKTVKNVFSLFSKFSKIWSPFPEIENENF